MELKISLCEMNLILKKLWYVLIMFMILVFLSIFGSRQLDETRLLYYLWTFCQQTNLRKVKLRTGQLADSKFLKIIEKLV